MSPRLPGPETQARIIDAAAACFAEVGYDAAGVAEVCRRAGVSKGAFYHHFASKHDLFMLLLTRWLASLDVKLLSAQGSSGNVPDELVSMAGMAGAVFEAARGQLPMFLEFWTKAARDPEVWQATIAPYHGYRIFFADRIRSGIAEGSLAPVDPDTAASAIVALAVGMLLQGLLDPTGADWGQSTVSGIQMLLNGMRPRRA
jgi:AcrR family transcriptional regulator